MPVLLKLTYYSGGATVTDDIISQNPSSAHFPTSVSSQITKLFLPRLESIMDPQSPPRTSSNSLYFIWGGINDVNLALVPVFEEPLSKNTSASFEDRVAGYSDHLIGESEWSMAEKLIGKVMDEYKEMLDQLYGAEARRLIVITVPPFHRAPAVLRRLHESQKTTKKLITAFNTRLAEMVNEWKSSHVNAEVTLWDSSDIFNKMLDEPKRWGFINAEDACTSGYA